MIVTSEENVDFTNIISFNPTAARLWREIEGSEFDMQRLTALLVEWYEIDLDAAQEDAENLVKAWIEAEIIEV